MSTCLDTAHTKAALFNQLEAHLTLHHCSFTPIAFAERGHPGWPTKQRPKVCCTLPCSHRSSSLASCVFLKRARHSLLRRFDCRSCLVRIGTCITHHTNPPTHTSPHHALLQRETRCMPRERDRRHSGCGKLYDSSWIFLGGGAAKREGPCSVPSRAQCWYELHHHLCSSQHQHCLRLLLPTLLPRIPAQPQRLNSRLHSSSLVHLSFSIKHSSTHTVVSFTSSFQSALGDWQDTGLLGVCSQVPVV